MSKRIQGNVIEKTWAAKTIQAYKDAATEAGLVLDYSKDSEDFPNSEMTQLEKLKELNAKGNGKRQIVVTRMARQLVRVDKDGKPKQVEYLTYGGEARITDHRGVPFAQDFEVGKYLRPNVVTNTGQRYNPETGQPLYPEKIISGQKPVYDTELELPKEKAARKKFIDNIIQSTDTYPESIAYYYKDLDAGFRDGTFSYEQFTNLSIEELRDLSKKGGGAKGSPYHRDKDGKLRDKDGNLVG
jgi:hypothetical protein